MPRNYNKRAARNAKEAENHVKELLNEADGVFSRDKGLANRYAEMAKKLILKFKLKLPNSLKKRICKHCHCFLKPGSNCRVRLGKAMMIYYCLDCKHHMRFKYKGTKT